MSTKRKHRIDFMTLGPVPDKWDIDFNFVKGEDKWDRMDIPAYIYISGMGGTWRFRLTHINDRVLYYVKEEKAGTSIDLILSRLTYIDPV